MQPRIIDRGTSGFTPQPQGGVILFTGNGINGVLITFVDDRPVVSILASNPDDRAKLEERARDIMLLLGVA